MVSIELGTVQDPCALPVIQYGHIPVTWKANSESDLESDSNPVHTSTLESQISRSECTAGTVKVQGLHGIRPTCGVRKWCVGFKAMNALVEMMESSYVSNNPVTKHCSTGRMIAEITLAKVHVNRQMLCPMHSIQAGEDCISLIVPGSF